jgi:hypothetical protein
VEYHIEGSRKNSLIKRKILETLIERHFVSKSYHLDIQDILKRKQKIKISDLPKGILKKPLSKA